MLSQVKQVMYEENSCLRGHVAGMYKRLEEERLRGLSRCSRQELSCLHCRPGGEGSEIHAQPHGLSTRCQPAFGGTFMSC